MKSMQYLSALLVLLIPCVASEAFASGGKTVLVTNNTSYTINEFYASPSNADGWDTGTNLIAGQSVAPGQAVTVTVADGRDDCTYDLMAILYGAAQYAYEYGVDTCSGGVWSITVSP